MLTDEQMLQVSKGIATWLGHLTMEGKISTETLRVLGDRKNLEQLYPYLRMAQLGMFDHVTEQILEKMNVSGEGQEE